MTWASVSSTKRVRLSVAFQGRQPRQMQKDLKNRQLDMAVLCDVAMDQQRLLRGSNIIMVCFFFLNPSHVTTGLKPFNTYLIRGMLNKNATTL